MERKKDEDLMIETSNSAFNGLLFIKNCMTKKMTLSDLAIKYFDLSSQEISFDDFIALVHPDSKKIVRNEFYKLEQCEINRIHYTFYIRSGEGKYRLCTLTATRESDQIDDAIIVRCQMFIHSEVLVRDPITNLYTQNALYDRLTYCYKNNIQSVVVGFEILMFHNVNSLYGYDFSNKALYKISYIYRQLLNRRGLIYKLDGSKFCILFDDNFDMIDLIIDEFKKITHNYSVDGISLSFDLSCVHIKSQNYYHDPRTLVARVASELEEIREIANRGIVYIDDETFENDAKQIELINTIINSISNNCEGFEIKYQPFISTTTGKIIGAEALLRFENKRYGEVQPLKFIDKLETQPCFYDLGLWIIKKAINDTKHFMKKNFDFFINVNLSFSQIENENFCNDVLSILKESKFPPKNIQFELTERCRSLDYDLLKDTLNFFQNNNIRIALDDFGTGISSLDLLCNLPINSVKIDQSFIRNILTNPNCQSIVDMTLQCAKRLGLKVCLEGVENKEIYEYVSQYNATYHQGYFYSVPLTFEEFCKEMDRVYTQHKISIIKNTGRNGLDVNNLLSMIPGGFFIYENEGDGRILSINEEVLRLFECDSVEEFSKITDGYFKGMVHKDDYLRVKAEIYQQISESKNKMDYVEYRIVTRKGNVKYVYDYGHLQADDNSQNLFYVFIVEKR